LINCFSIFIVNVFNVSSTTADFSNIFVISQSLVLDLHDLMEEYFKFSVASEQNGENNSEWLEFSNHFCYDLGRCIGYSDYIDYSSQITKIEDSKN